MRLNLSYEDWIFRIVPGKCPPPNFDSFVVFEVLHVTALHAKSWCNESKGRSAVIVLRHFWGHDIRFTHTCPWPCLQHSSPAARNLRTASNDWMLWKLGNEATSWSALQHVTAFSTVGLASTKHERSDDASRFGTPWQLTLQPVWALASWIVEPFKHLLRATADPQFWRLSCECPWVLARDNTVNDFMWLLRSLNERQPHKLHNKTLHIYMHCYSMYGLCLIRGDNDCVAIAWKL